ncbi:MAG: RES domain-containing protein [Gemmatimonadetes bacterium]|nr:RES domain-containing protein [Gemmatimonadota bacterium]
MLLRWLEPDIVEEWLTGANAHLDGATPAYHMALFWRVIPWDADVREGSRFSPSWIPPTTGRGRFDLPVACSPVLYLAESPAHAVAEALQPWRNRPLCPYVR